MKKHVTFLVTTVLIIGGSLSAAPVDFAREILPILSNKCFVCHGPDGEKKDVIRLDSFKEATRDLDGYKAIDPAAPEKSELLVRLHDKEEPMPPKKALLKSISTASELFSSKIESSIKN